MQSLVEQLPPGGLDRSLLKRQRQVERWATILGASGISLFVVAIIWAIVYKIIILKGDVAEGLAFLAFIVGLIVFALLLLYRESLLKAASHPAPERLLPHAEDTGKRLPESSLEPIPSVTERTTELLTLELTGSKTNYPTVQESLDHAQAVGFTERADREN